MVTASLAVPVPGSLIRTLFIFSQSQWLRILFIYKFPSCLGSVDCGLIVGMRWSGQIGIHYKILEFTDLLVLHLDPL